MNPLLLLEILFDDFNFALDLDGLLDLTFSSDDLGFFGDGCSADDDGGYLGSVAGRIDGHCMVRRWRDDLLAP